MLSAEELYDRGVAALEAGRLTPAGRLLETALTRVDAEELEARILLSLAYHRSERAQVEDGLSLLEQAEGKARAVPLRALIASQRGLLLMRSGDADGALSAFTVALEGLDDAPAAVARAALNRGNVHLQRRDLSHARTDFRRCADVATHAGLDVLRAKAEHNLGYVELLAGQLPVALRLMEQARRTLADTGPAVAAVIDVDRAQAMIAAGLLTDAERTMASASRALGHQRLRQSQAEAELGRALLAIAQDRPAQAVGLARRAATRFRRRGSESWALRADATGLAALAQAHSRSGLVLAEGPRLADALRAQGLHDEGRRLRLHCALAALTRSEIRSASELLASTRVPATAPITTRLLDRAVRADLAVARRRPGQAGRHLRRGLADLFAWQSSFGSLDLQTGVALHGRALAVRGLRLAVDDGRPEVVYGWTERARAFASRLPPMRPPADAEGAAVLEELRQLRAESGPSPGSATRRRMTELEQQIRDRALYSPGPGIVTEPLPLNELQALLVPTSGTLVAHVVVDERVHALVVTGDRTSFHPLGPLAPVSATRERISHDLDAAAAVLPPAIRDAVAESLRSCLHQLADVLWRPLSDQGLLSSDGPLLLVPSAALVSVPWTLLPELQGRPLTLARTATAWAHTRRPAEPVRAVGLVAGPDVPRAGEEVSRAAKAWSGVTVVDPAGATTAAVTRLASEVDLIHVAAHGTHSADNPLFSALELAHGPWFGHDIAAVSPVPAHVVLSSCELGQSSVRSGEETLGMTAAWLHAGTRSVVASPVRINDDTACEVFADHHARVAAGAAPAVALAGVLSGLPGGAAPAPLVCFGAGW